MENQTIKKKLEEIKSVLGEKGNEILAPNKEVKELFEEKFQSKTFINAGFNLMDSNGSDRTLYTITFTDDSQVFILTGKISSRNPYEVGHAADEGMDLRKEQITIYIYDGGSTITEMILNTKESKEYKGEFGKPEALLPHLKKTAGTSIGVKKY